VAIATGLLLCCAAPAVAGSNTAGSIISKQNAIATASSALPSGAQINAVQCITLIRDLSPRYSCTVRWSESGG